VNFLAFEPVNDVVSVAEFPSLPLLLESLYRLLKENSVHDVRVPKHDSCWISNLIQNTILILSCS
jgi:hypothetical protein